MTEILPDGYFACDQCSSDADEKCLKCEPARDLCAACFVTHICSRSQSSAMNLSSITSAGVLYSDDEDDEDDEVDDDEVEDDSVPEVQSSKKGTRSKKSGGKRKRSTSRKMSKQQAAKQRTEQSQLGKDTAIKLHTYSLEFEGKLRARDFAVEDNKDGSSWVWAHFKKFKDPSKAGVASCNTCRALALSRNDDLVVMWHIKYDKSTGHLDRHLRRWHKDIIEEHNALKATAAVSVQSGCGQSGTMMSFVNKSKYESFYLTNSEIVVRFYFFIRQ